MSEPENRPSDLPRSGPRHLWFELERRVSENRWLIIGMIAAVAFALGYFGFSQVQSATSLSHLDRLYRSLQLFVLESGDVAGPIPLTLELARWLAWAATVLAAVGAVLVIVRDHMGRIRVWRARGHVIICGLGRCGTRLALGFRKQGYPVVAVERDPAAPGVEACRRHGIVVLPGHGEEPATLRRAGIRRARYLVTACGDDGVNVDATTSALSLVDPGTHRPLYCFSNIADPDLRASLRESAIRSSKARAFRLEPFEIAELGAPGMLREFPPFDEAGRADSRVPHVVIVGLGQTGRVLALGMAHLWTQAQVPDRLRLTVLDDRADELAESLTRRSPQIEEALDLTAISLDVDAPLFPQPDLLRILEGEWGPTSIYVCLDEEIRGLRTALILQRRLADERVTIVVRTTQRATISAFSIGLEDARATVHVFNMLDRVCTPDVILRGTNEVLAMAAHEEYVRSERAAGQTIGSNPSLTEWSLLPEHLKESNRAYAAHIGQKLRAVGCDIRGLADVHLSGGVVTFSPSEVERLARMEHDRWLEERLGSGWKLAARKDVTRKESPYLVPWQDLSEEVREKDRILVRSLPTFLAKAGCTIVRTGRHSAAADPRRTSTRPREPSAGDV